MWGTQKGVNESYEFDSIAGLYRCCKAANGTLLTASRQALLLSMFLSSPQTKPSSVMREGRQGRRL